MAGAGYDISASASNSSSAATGAIKFGAVNVVSNAASPGLSWKIIVLAVVLPGGLVALAVWYFWKKRKG